MGGRSYKRDLNSSLVGFNVHLEFDTRLLQESQKIRSFPVEGFLDGGDLFVVSVERNVALKRAVVALGTHVDLSALGEDDEGVLEAYVASVISHPLCSHLLEFSNMLIRLISIKLSSSQRLSLIATCLQTEVLTLKESVDQAFSVFLIFVFLTGSNLAIFVHDDQVGSALELKIVEGIAELILNHVAVECVLHLLGVVDGVLHFTVNRESDKTHIAFAVVLASGGHELMDILEGLN